jgi:cytochrome b6-f complex iron-sulfur subunit
MVGDRPAEFIDDLLRRRRPRRFQAGGEDLEAMSAVVDLVSAGPGADRPDPAFVERLRRRLASELDQAPNPVPSPSRRRLLQAAVLGAAAALVGGVVDHSLLGFQAGGEPAVVPNGAGWRPVAALSDLPAGRALAYSTPAVRVLLVNDGGTIRALSGVCTHLGCLLAPSSITGQIDCPCHRTAFAFDGSVVSHELPSAPARLPIVRSRVRGEEIELYLV